MKKYRVLQCLCLDCHWIWEILSKSFDDRIDECPNCKSFDIKTVFKKV